MTSHSGKNSHIYNSCFCSLKTILDLLYYFIKEKPHSLVCPQTSFYGLYSLFPLHSHFVLYGKWTYLCKRQDCKVIHCSPLLCDNFFGIVRCSHGNVNMPHSSIGCYTLLACFLVNMWFPGHLYGVPRANVVSVSCVSPY